MLRGSQKRSNQGVSQLRHQGHQQQLHQEEVCRRTTKSRWPCHIPLLSPILISHTPISMQTSMPHNLTLTHTHISYPYLIRANLKASICLIPIPARSRPGGSVSHPNSAGGQGADGEGWEGGLASPSSPSLPWTMWSGWLCFFAGKSCLWEAQCLQVLLLGNHLQPRHHPWKGGQGIVYQLREDSWRKSAGCAEQNWLNCTGSAGQNWPYCTDCAGQNWPNCTGCAGPDFLGSFPSWSWEVGCWCGGQVGKGRARFRQDFLLYPVEILPYVYVLILCLILDFLFMQIDP